MTVVYVCNTCGAEFKAFAPAQRHAHTHVGARIRIEQRPSDVS